MKLATVTTQDNIRDAVEQVFPFEVQKLPLQGPDNLKTGVFGLFRDDTGDFVGSSSVTKVYRPHSTDDVITLAEAGSTVFDGEAEVKCHWKDGHYLSIQPTKDYRHQVYGTNDGIFPRIVIRAGYDGQSFGAAMGYWRDVCRNLAILRMVQGTSVAIRHTSGLRAQINQLIVQFQAMSGGWKAITDRIDQMERRHASVRDFLHEMYGDVPESGKKKTMHETRTRNILDSIIRERVALAKSNAYDLNQASAWELFNAIQGYEQHTAIRRVRGGGKLSDFERIIQAAAKKDVMKAEKLVMEMAV